MFVGLALLILSGTAEKPTGAFITDTESSAGNSFSVAAVFPSSCGNGEVEEGEECDGNLGSCTTLLGYSGMRGCTESCLWDECITDEYCGDGTVNGPEECDDGVNNGVNCLSDCTLPSMCSARPDVMLVFQRSGGTSGDMDTLKAAAHSFVDNLTPELDGPHIGQASYADEGTLDQILTGDRAAIDAAIELLDTGSNTNLYGGLLNATTELTGPNDRNDAGSPDYMILIADKMPNKPGNPGTGEAAAIAQADAAKAAGIKIYVVFVGTNAGWIDWYRTNIPTDTTYFFSASDYSGLEAILWGIAHCQSP